MKTRITLGIGIVISLFGAVLGFKHGLAFAFNHTPPQQVVAPAKPSAYTPVDKLSGKPIRIVIPSVGIDIAVVDGFYNQRTQTWSLSETEAQYATITPLANTVEGNTFIYGHNRPAVFKSLLDAKAGASAMVYTDNGHQFIYKLRSWKATKPTDDSLFYYQGQPILTVQTCSGTFFQNRSLYTFDLVEAK